MVVYSAIENRSCGKLYVQTLDKRFRRSVAPKACGFAPDWSPDSSSIVFARTEEIDGAFGTSILVADAFSGAGERRVKFVTGGRSVTARWMPDSASIAVGGSDGVEIVRASDGKTMSVLSGVENVAGLASSPDGRLLVYSHAEPLELTGKVGHRLSVSSIDGLTRRPLTLGDSDKQPDWRRRCTIYGTDGNDRLTGSARNDIICALKGDDIVSAGGGDDILIGGDGDDRLVGGAGADRLFGGGGNDRIAARDSERDVVMAGTGKNTVDADAFDITLRL